MKTWIYFLQSKKTGEILSTLLGDGSEHHQDIKNYLESTAGNPKGELYIGSMDLDCHNDEFYFTRHSLKNPCDRCTIFANFIVDG